MMPITTCNKFLWMHRYITNIVFGKEREKSFPDFDPQLSTVLKRRITAEDHIRHHYCSLSLRRGQTLVAIRIPSPIYKLEVASLLYSLKILLAVLVMESPFLNISQGSSYNGIECHLSKSNNIYFYLLIYK